MTSDRHVEGEEERRRRTDESMAIWTEWRSGPRTPAWDALWRRLLSDLRATAEESTSQPAPQTGAPND